MAFKFFSTFPTTNKKGSFRSLSDSEFENSIIECIKKRSRADGFPSPQKGVFLHFLPMALGSVGIEAPNNEIAVALNSLINSGRIEVSFLLFGFYEIGVLLKLKE